MKARQWSIPSLIESHQRIALDADVLIYLLEDVEPHASRSAAVVDAVDQGLIRASMSAIAHAEILVGPARSNDAARFEQTAAELRGVNVEILSVTAAIAEDAAWLRGQGALQLIDAIHVASARTAGATAFVTNDHRVRSMAGLDVYLLDGLDARPAEDVATGGAAYTEG